jgi:ribosomal RNA-processing protein 36
MSSAQSRPSGCVDSLLQNGFDESTDYAAVRKELSDMSLGDLVKLKEKLGSKIYDELMFGTNKPLHTAQVNKPKFSRENKNRPMEMSSKRPVSRSRTVVSTGKQVTHRDPRFDDLSGSFEESYFKHNYSFITDIRLREKQKLLKMLRKSKDPDKAVELQNLITRLTQQEKAEHEKEERKKREQMWKKKEKELVVQGKKPFYLKKSEKRKLELAAKFSELEQTGQVSKYIVKKKKKNAKIDKKRLPSAVAGVGQKTH